MGLDVTGLANYVDQNKLELIRASLLKGRTMELINVQAGIKHTAAINILTSTDAWAAGGGCGFNATGDVVLSQRNIVVADLQNHKSICLKDLNKKYTSTLMNAGSYEDSLPFEALYSEELSAQTSKMIDTLAWKGDTANGLADNNTLTDGYIKIIDAEGTVVDGGAGTMSAATIIDEVDVMVSLVPVDVISSEDVKIFMGLTEFRVYTAALTKANLYHYKAEEGKDFRMYVPGTNVEVIGLAGLNASGRMFLGETSNFYAGVDMLDDSEKFDLFFAKEANEMRLIQEMKIGFQIAFPARIVSNSIAI